MSPAIALIIARTTSKQDSTVRSRDTRQSRESESGSRAESALLREYGRAASLPCAALWPPRLGVVDTELRQEGPKKPRQPSTVIVIVIVAAAAASAAVE